MPLESSSSSSSFFFFFFLLLELDELFEEDDDFEEDLLLEEEDLLFAYTRNELSASNVGSMNSITSTASNTTDDTLILINLLLKVLL